MIALSFLLPIAFPLLLGWMQLLLGIPVFFLLRTEEKALFQLRNGLLIAGIGAMLLGEPALLIFSFTLLPLAWSLHRSAQHEVTPAAAGRAGLAVLGSSWLIFWLLYGQLTGVNPYTSLLAQLNNLLTQIVEAYGSSMKNVSVELLQEFELAAADMRVVLPKVLPGLLAGSAVLTVWLNMVVGNGLLRRFQPDKAPWPEYRCWQLPDTVVWLLIAAIILAITSAGWLEITGYSLAVVIGLLYFFQGAAVFAHLLHRWNVPTFWRIVLYIFVAAQGYGFLLLAVTGAADTWADFRKLAQNEQPPTRS